MAGFLDVLLRGLILVFASLVLGGVAWTRLVLRAEPHVKPSPATTLALRGVAVAAAVEQADARERLLDAIVEAQHELGRPGGQCGAGGGRRFEEQRVRGGRAGDRDQEDGSGRESLEPSQRQSSRTRSAASS